MDGFLCHGLWVPRSDAEVFSRYAEFEGLPDLDVSKVAKCSAFSPSFGVALDIGAHIGAVSVYLARKFEQVIALEAVPETFEFLRRNTADLSNVTALNVAAGPTAGETYLSHYPAHGQLSHVAPDADVPQTERIGPITVVTIDGLNLSDVSFIKIDVEGFELPVLEGARRTLETFRPLVLVEQGGNEELHFGRPRDEASAFLESLGMRRHEGAPPKMKKDRLYTF
jgi:FkbM family methyltransferase